MISMKNPNDETWRDVPAFEGQYQVSDHGRVKTLARKSGKKSVVESIMKQHLDNGYLSVWLRKPGGIHKKCRIHRLVAVAFLPAPAEPIESLVVNHKDRDRLNNMLSNLEWMTYSENGHHYVRDDKLKAGQVEILTAADIPF